MIEQKNYICEKCEEVFTDKDDCQRHEENCQVVHTFKCDKCGKEIQYSDDWNSELFFYREECWNIDLGRPGYGSKLDGCDVNFNLCDDCLYELIESFTVDGKVKIHNSGSNTYGSNEDWIRIEKGEMSDEEIEDMGLISPRQISAYEERFPICDKVKLYKYEDVSCGCFCDVKCAFGDWDEENEIVEIGLNVSSDCYNCNYFVERKDGEGIEVVFR